MVFLISTEPIFQKQISFNGLLFYFCRQQHNKMLTEVFIKAKVKIEDWKFLQSTVQIV